MLQTLTDYCPCCGEAIELVVDCSIAEQTYIEDCFVCCQPMVVEVIATQDAVFLTLKSEQE